MPSQRRRKRPHSLRAGWPLAATAAAAVVGYAALALASRSLTLVTLRPSGVFRRRQGGPTRVGQRALSEAEVGKIDGSPDELFYVLPRIGVYHVDEGFRSQLTQLYRRLLPPGGDILDLCSQHDSHLPPEVQYGSLTVHGMNYLELLANPRATQRFARNFNEDPSLRELPDGSLDAALMTVSIQYMQRPVEVLREVRRCLRPGGVVIVSFSNRMFFTKAIEAWRSKQSMRGLAELVTGYFEEAGFLGVRAANGVRLPEEQKEKSWLPSVLPQALGDPFIAAVGFKDRESQNLTNEEGISWLVSSGAGSIW